MPKLATKEKVLDGRAEIVTFTTAPGWFLRVYVAATAERARHYRTQQIPADCIEDARKGALDVLMDMSASGISQRSSRSENTTKPPVKPKQVGNNLEVHQLIVEFIAKTYERAHAGKVSEEYADNLKECFRNHLEPYLQERRIYQCKDFKLNTFDDLELSFGANVTKHTCRTRMCFGIAWLKWLRRKEALPIACAMNLKDMIKLPKLVDTDMQGNPPFTAHDWQVFNKGIRDWVKESEGLNKQGWHDTRVEHWRHMCWTLWMLLKTSGMRPKEALALRWCDLEFENVPRDTSRGEEEDRYLVHIRIRDSKTGGMREVSANCATRLIKWRDRVDARIEAKARSIKRTENSLIFGRDYELTKIPVYNVINKSWREVRDNVQMDLKGSRMSNRPYTMYSMRSSRVNELIEAGVDPLVIAKQLGHSAGTMMRYYDRSDIRERATKEAVFGVIKYGEKPKKAELYSSEEVSSSATRKHVRVKRRK